MPQSFFLVEVGPPTTTAPLSAALITMSLRFFRLSSAGNDWHYLFATSTYFIQTWQKKIGNFLVRSSFQTNDQSKTLKCARSRCKTCSFIHNIQKHRDPRDPLRSLITSLHSTNLFLFSRHPIPTNSVAPLSAYKPKHNPQFLQSL